MDELEYLICEFENLKFTHPNLSNLWLHYLTQKKHRLSKITSTDAYLTMLNNIYNIIEQANNTILCIKNNHYNDLNRENILTLYCLAHYI
jgi:hypothetical protein